MGAHGKVMVLPALLAALLCSCAELPPVAEKTEDADFREIRHFMEVYYDIRFSREPELRRRWAPYYRELHVREVKKTRNRYLLGVPRVDGRYEIVIRGTANVRNALYDIKFIKNRNPKLGINLHRGFEKAALGVYHDALPLLTRGPEVYIYGHSLGAAEAVILGMLLREDGYNVKKIIASGQPKVTDEAGALKYRSLPVLRIVLGRDVVPALPPAIVYKNDPYRHIHGRVLIFDGPRGAVKEDCVRGAESATGPSVGFTNQKVIDRLKDHHIRNYLRAVRSLYDPSARVSGVDKVVCREKKGF